MAMNGSRTMVAIHTMGVIVRSVSWQLDRHLKSVSVWSNFEIGDLDFFRSKAYATFFEHLDASGNFFYERWGDAPVHSIGVALLLPLQQIHYFNDIGYHHVPFWNCPDNPLNSKLECKCQREQAFGQYHSVLALPPEVLLTPFRFTWCSMLGEVQGFDCEFHCCLILNHLDGYHINLFYPRTFLSPVAYVYIFV